MSILEELLSVPLADFRSRYLYKEPFASPERAARYRRLLSWDLLAEIFISGHSDCWLAKNGRLPQDTSLTTGRLTLEQAFKGFTDGYTVLVRHSERAHPKLAAIAEDFHQLFQAPIDIQLYCTPSGEEGFDWHYDIEEVFVVQSSGEKEFWLRRNRTDPPPSKTTLPATLDFDKECVGPEIRCHLNAGDWLYIPSGFWHKARAITPSFHLSVGVLSRAPQG